MHYNSVFKIGDILLRPKALAFVHQGIAVGPDAVLHNTPARGEHISNFAEFALGHPVTVVPSGLDRNAILVRVRRVLSRAKTYNPFARNCEHTVSETLWGNPKSATLVGVLGLIALVLLVIAIFRSR